MRPGIMRRLAASAGAREAYSTRSLPPAVKFTRIHGSTKPISTDFGEACYDKNILKSPQYATLKPGTSSIVHATVGMLSPSMVA